MCGKDVLMIQLLEPNLKIVFATKKSPFTRTSSLPYHVYEHLA